MKKFHFKLKQEGNFLTVYLNGEVNRMLTTHNKEMLSRNLKELEEEIEHLKTYAKVTVENEHLMTL